MRISITATSGQSIAARSKNANGSVKASTFQPIESRRRLVAFRIEGSSSSRYTATVSLLSATISISPIICESGIYHLRVVLPYVRAHTHKNRVRIAEWPSYLGPRFVSCGYRADRILHCPKKSLVVERLHKEHERAGLHHSHLGGMIFTAS